MLYQELFSGRGGGGYTNGSFGDYIAFTKAMNYINNLPSNQSAGDLVYRQGNIVGVWVSKSEQISLAGPGGINGSWQLGEQQVSSQFVSLNVASAQLQNEIPQLRLDKESKFAQGPQQYDGIVPWYVGGPASVKGAKLVFSSRGLAQIGTKLQYLFGKATGSAHNIERSTGMLRQLESVGIFDNLAGRSLLNSHLDDAYAATKGILQSNGKILRESVLMGPNGGLGVQSYWQGNKLITVILLGR